MNIDPALASEFIRSRRSVFPEQYTGQKVDDSIVQEILKNACSAPTHKLTQPWRFIVFTGEGIRRLAEAQAEVYRKVTTADGTFRQDKFTSLLQKPVLSSHIIVVCMKRDEAGSVPEIEEIGAVFCAVENMYLTATAYGVGCYLSTGGITYFEKAKEIFELGSEDKLIGFFHVGTPRVIPPQQKRRSVDELVSWVDV